MSSFKIRGVNFVIINQKDEVLIQKRSLDAPISPGEYCFPGGGIEPNENPERAFIREVFEETGLRVKKFKLICGFEYTLNGDKKFNLFYLCRIKNQKVLSKEGEMIWFSFDKLESIKLVHKENILIPIIRGFL